MYIKEHKRRDNERKGQKKRDRRHNLESLQMHTHTHATSPLVFQASF